MAGGCVAGKEVSLRFSAAGEGWEEKGLTAKAGRREDEVQPQIAASGMGINPSGGIQESAKAGAGTARPHVSNFGQQTRGRAVPAPILESALSIHGLLDAGLDAEPVGHFRRGHVL
jgi:hypothetical protein